MYYSADSHIVTRAGRSKMIGINNELKRKFRKGKRYSNFGEIINSISISGVRGVKCNIRFDYPVTAFTGMNGAGKTTLIQLLACAYKKDSKLRYERHYINKYFPASIADKSLFEDDCKVEYTYQNEDMFGLFDHTHSLQREASKWVGYKGQPVRTTLLIGPAYYLPKYERSDLTVYEADHLTSMGRSEIENGTAWISRILGGEYEDVFIQHVKGKSRNTELGMAQRMNANYSENNMGLGEGRVIRIVRDLETCPEKSLVLLDEADIGLHSFAKCNFSQYLMSVSYRRGHQIFFSTHSSEMVNELPLEGRIMMERQEKGIMVHKGMSSINIRKALSEGKDGFLIVCVEDSFAANLFSSIVSNLKSDLSNLIRVHIADGDAPARSSVKYLRKCGIVSIAVLDGDRKEEKEKYIFTLPEDGVYPETLVFLSPPVKKMLLCNYKFDFDKYLSENENINHHSYSSVIGRSIGKDKSIVESICISEFVKRQSKGWCKDLINNIKSNLPT